MKAKINLYNHSPNGRIDTYQPYKRKEQHATVAVDQERRFKAAYSVNYNQACLLLQAIRMNGRRPLSPQCILQLASFVSRAWESNPGEERVDELARLMTNLLHSTLLCGEKPFDEALKQFCRNNVPTHTVSPSITLLIAIGYIQRLKQRYTHIKGTSGCGHRLIMVAYMMAAKFMHVNLRSIIDVSDKESTSPNVEPTTAAPFSCERSTLHHDTHPRKTSLPSIIPEQQLPSPPTSPTSLPDSDPLNYHYFSATKGRESTSPIQTPSPSPPRSHQPERHLQILRMEFEFLHFLNYDLSVSDTIKLIHWAQRFDDDILPSIKQPGVQVTGNKHNHEDEEYSSADDGDDELDKYD